LSLESAAQTGSSTRRHSNGGKPADRPHAALPHDEMLLIYRRLLFARYLDITLYDMKKKARITRGEVYSYRGQEAICVGSISALREDDLISPVHRDIAAFYLKGMSLREVMSQIYGRASAPGKAMDVWTHFGDLTRGIIHSTSMLASTLPVGCGVAQALKMDGRDSVVVCYLGEGATARGDLHESLNYAALQKLPLIVIVENNQWAYSTPVEQECPTPHVADRAKGYGIPNYTIDGQDTFAVYDTTAECIARARRGGGPSFVECVTYRVHGHASHDDTKATLYRPKEQHDRWTAKDRDPLFILRNRLIKYGFKQSELPVEADADMVREMQDAIEYAQRAPMTAAEEALTDLFDESAGVSL
jgi:TPP-dependent pyruvate/acetoin dehydrogenase alpha subunit